jgi:hypothetical protein
VKPPSIKLTAPILTFAWIKVKQTSGFRKSIGVRIVDQLCLQVCLFLFFFSNLLAGFLKPSYPGKSEERPSRSR